MRVYLKEIIKGQRKFSDVWQYVLGHLRYKLYYSKNFKFLIRSHIFEQIEHRLNWMDIDCYVAGECKICGCATPQLQMSNKSCEKPCYPTMMTRTKWHEFMFMGWVVKDEHGVWGLEDKKPIILNDEQAFSQVDY